MMNQFSILILFLLFFTSCSGKSKSENKLEIEENMSVIAQADTVRLLTEPIYEIHDVISNNANEGELYTNKEDNEQELTFNQLISKIPVTPLPFGVKNLNDIDLSLPPMSLLNVPIDYDKENISGLNYYFEEHEELDPFVEHDGRCMPYNEDGSKTYFSRRLPDLITGEKVLLYYYTKPEVIRIGTENGGYYDKNWSSEKWLILVCEPNGKAVYTDHSILSSDQYMRISYIDENYNIHTRHYQSPATRSIRSDRTPNGEIDQVSVDILRAKLTTLFHESFYKLQKPKTKDNFNQTGRWYSTKDSNSHFIQYLWIDNKAVEVNGR